MYARSSYPNGFRNGVEIRGLPVLNTYSGRVLWVSSVGSAHGDGTFDRPFSTIDAAINRAQANDLIMVKAGHAETIAAAAGIDCDVQGITIQGLGSGTDMPEITFATATTADIDIDAANVTLRGLRFKCAIANMAAGIDVNSTDFTIEDCEFHEDGTTGLSWIDINGGSANACDRARIRGNKFMCATAGNWDFAIELGEVCDGVEIIGNRISGDFDDAAIHNPTGKVLTGLLIQGNNIRNAQAGTHGIELVSACTGSIIDNRLMIHSSSTPIDAGACSCMQNFYNTTTGGDTEGVPANPTIDATYNLVGADDSNNLAATTNVAANGDGSVLERLELIQQSQPAAALDRNAGNYLTVLADFTSSTWNTVAAHEILTVTGMVHVVIIPEVVATPTSAGSGATLTLGDETTANSIIASTDAENLATGEVWFDATDTRTLAARSIFEKTDVVVGGGKDIGYTVGGEALTGGSIRFHMWWWPINSTGAAVAGAGGAL